MRKFAVLLLMAALPALAQQPQTQTAPEYPVNAKYVQGVGPGYWPTAVAGSLTVDLSAGTAFCGGSVQTYAGGTLTMTASTTNYIYLDTSASCAPAVKTAGFTTSDIPIATVVAGASSITSIADDRTMFKGGSNTLGAAGIYGSITPGDCTKFYSATQVEDSGSPCGSSSITLQTNGTNNASQSLLNLVAGSNVTLSNTSGGDVKISATGSSANGVQYNPSTTNYIVLSSSNLQDDNHMTSSAVPVSTWSCGGTTCTVVTSSAHGLSAGDWVQLNLMTSWFATPADHGPADTGVGVFQVLPTGLTSTQFEVDYTANTGSCSSSCGNIYNADQWAVYAFAREPFVESHGSVTNVQESLATAAANFSSVLGPLCTAGSPSYLIIENGQDDISAVPSVSTMESNFQSIWSQAHADGCIVVQGSVLPTNFGLSLNGTPSTWTTISSLNSWLPAQGLVASNGEYWDDYIDFASFANEMGSGNWVGNSAGANEIWANRVNGAIANHKDAPSGPASLLGQFYNSSIGGITAHWATTFNLAANGGQFAFLDSTLTPWLTFTSWDNVIYNLLTTATAAPIQKLFGALNTGASGCQLLGHDTTYSNDSFERCFGYAGQNSASNFYSIGSNGVSTPALKIFANNALQFPQLTAPSGTAPLVVDTSGNVSVGSSTADPMATLGDTIYGGSGGTETRLAGNTSTTTECLTQTGTGSASAAPAWGSCAGSGGSITVENGGTSLGSVTTLNCSTGTTCTASGGTATITAAGAGTGALVLLQTESASNSPSLAFTSVMSSTYNEYRIECENLLPASSGVALAAQLSTDNGSTWDTTAADYMGGSHYTRMDATTNSYGDNSGKTTFAGAYLTDSYGNYQPGVTARILLYNPATANDRQFTVQANGAGAGSAGSGYYTQTGGALWKNTSQANALKILFLSSGSPTASVNITSGSCSLYGIEQ